MSGRPAVVNGQRTFTAESLCEEGSYFRWNVCGTGSQLRRLHLMGEDSRVWGGLLDEEAALEGEDSQLRLPICGEEGV